MANVELSPAKLTTWRKIALGSWHGGGDPSVYGVIDIDVTKILAHQKSWSARNGGKKPPNFTALVSKAAASTLHQYPELNGLIRWGRIYLRKNVAVFLQAAVDDAGKDLSGFVIYDAETKTIEQFVDEIASKARAVREDKDLAFKKAKANFKHLPAFVMRHVLNLTSFLLYTLNLDMRWAGLPKDPFGSIMVTSVGGLGVDEAFAPLVAYSRVPVLLAVGAVRDRAVVIDGKIAIAPVLKICVTFDHRFVDGVYGSRMIKALRRLLETDAGLDELGLK
ncbi:MAG: 2-oxo acid dehydrogenase subunit E2 [Deltaproteobacteria bacterium]|nr:2-oxo acid dehydrogenase subunit E2 [Deltaproteobacteria bacterium]